MPRKSSQERREKQSRKKKKLMKHSTFLPGKMMLRNNNMSLMLRRESWNRLCSKSNGHWRLTLTKKQIDRNSFSIEKEISS